ncbi:MAG: class II D-tagatose-bisphosphate aldolase, non-catalytic subunit [Chlorobi bacterium]|nr:class II D-tagatose-bisphosphate aldolase, non-catalytic subunit [Chlorobiota bacterium]
MTDIIQRNIAGEKIGIASVCSSNNFVIEAAVLFAKRKSLPLLVESTSNQVDQFGGYSGMTPADFRDYVFGIAEASGFPKEKIILGGDHLGPNVWQNENAETAMNKAEEQIRAYVRAGFSKIHLDTSFRLNGDPGERNKPLGSKIITERAAFLCKAAEDESAKIGLKNNPVYVIGTDVPIPGGAREKEDLHITTEEELTETIELSKKSFGELRLDHAWERVIAVVTQPGVEFSDGEVIPYSREIAAPLKQKIESCNSLALEAHSTDYQTKTALKEMVADHFAILKVGPMLTFALREALFSLAMIEEELFGGVKSVTLSGLINAALSAMNENPKYWSEHYRGSEKEILLSQKYSYSDRIRYYWGNKKLQTSINLLLKNLTVNKIPLNVLSQFMPEEYDDIRTGELENIPLHILYHKISKVFDIYYFATNESET